MIRAMRGWLGAVVATMVMVLAVAAPARGNVGSSVADGWNNDNIQWLDYEPGLKVAKAAGKPVFLVAHTTWCPHCKHYQKLFFDPRIVELAKAYVMVMIDRDLDTELNKTIGPNGQTFVPRTVVMHADGTVRLDVTGSRREHPNFIDYRSPDELIRVMEKGRTQ